jgi:HlyD family secretion protein
VVVVKTLNVEEGDRVKAGQILATLDTGDVLAARIGRIEAELVNARRELARSERLLEEDVLQEAERDRWESEVAVLEAEKRQAEAELDRSIVYAPIDGQVLEVHTRPGERVGENGIVELAKTHRMYAIAEVYEADIGRVRRGQRATVTSPALPEPLTGTVEWIRLEVAKQDALGTDPAARKDARVVEVRVRLDDSDAAWGLTNLEVEVLIEPTGESD